MLVFPVNAIELSRKDALPASPFNGCGAGMRILVIDDDESVRSAIQTLLNRQGREVVAVENGPLGIQAFETSRFDLVMCDIFMPGVDGLETIKDLHRRASTVPIIAMSGFRFRDSMAPTPDFLKMAEALGATSCLRKPFTPQQLLAAINPYFEHAAPKTSVAGS